MALFTGIYWCDYNTIQAQNEFLSFGGIRALLPYVKPSTKFQVLCMACLDIFILLSSEAGEYYYCFPLIL